MQRQPERRLRGRGSKVERQSSEELNRQREDLAKQRNEIESRLSVSEREIGTQLGKQRATMRVAETGTQTESVRGEDREQRQREGAEVGAEIQREREDLETIRCRHCCGIPECKQRDRECPDSD